MSDEVTSDLGGTRRPKARALVYLLLALVMLGLVGFTLAVPASLRRERVAANDYLKRCGAVALVAKDPRLAGLQLRVVPKGIYISVHGRTADRAALEGLLTALRSEPAPVPVRLEVEVGSERFVAGICSHPPDRVEAACPACHAKGSQE